MPNFLKVLFFCSFLCAPAYPQDFGVIQCDPGSVRSIPAWIAPGVPYVVEQLKCGRTVQIVERGNYRTPSQYSSRPPEYVKIQLGEYLAYVDPKYVKLSNAREQSRPANSEIASAIRPSAAEQEEKKKWALVTKDRLKLRDETLSPPIYVNGVVGGSRTFTATLSNNSNYDLSHLRVLVRIYDCSGKPDNNYNNCETIGEASPVIPISVPSGQTRLVTGSMQFDATPRVKKTFAWSYQVLEARAE